MRGPARSGPRPAARGGRPRAGALLAFFPSRSRSSSPPRTPGASGPGRSPRRAGHRGSVRGGLRGAHLQGVPALDGHRGGPRDRAQGQRREGSPGAETQSQRQRPVLEWRYEGVGIAAVVAYVLNYIRGNAANRNIARAFEEAFLSCDASDGDGVTSATSVTSVTRASLSHPTAAPCSEPSSRRLVSWRRRTRRIRRRARASRRPLSREAPDEYRCWATGRRFLTGALVTLRLRKRHDLFRLFVRVPLPGGGGEGRSGGGVFLPRRRRPPRVLLRARRAERDARWKRARSALRTSRVFARSASGPRTPPEGEGWSAELVLKAESAELGADVVFEEALETLFSERAYALLSANPSARVSKPRTAWCSARTTRCARRSCRRRATSKRKRRKT